MIRIPEDQKIRRSISLFVFALGIACMALRIVAVSFWSVTKGHILEESIAIEAALTVLSDVILLCMIGLVVLRANRVRDEFSYDPVASTLTIYSVSALALLVFAAIVPKDFEDGRLTSVIGVIT
ncbi:MAG: hypothetical protein NTX15_01320, partial [Candidatus Kapabacteria bacterium]|nr:hypothetical protein [Candidatus Kapabacteria bacterium]